MYLEIHTANAHMNVLGAPECPACCAICTLYLKALLGIDEEGADFLSEYTGFDGSSIDCHIYFLEWEGVVGGIDGGCWGCVNQGAEFFECPSFDSSWAESLGKHFLDRALVGST